MTQPENNNWQVESYRQRWDVELLDSLGAGIQGNVFSAISPRHRYVFAVKFHRREVAFYRELTVYRRIQELEINEVCGHQVPQLLAHDTELFVLEMTIVTPPFIVDFGGAYLDRPPDYSDEVWRDWRKEKSEDFEDNWPAVEQILDEFRWMGIHIADVNPGNIRF